MLLSTLTNKAIWFWSIAIFLRLFRSAWNEVHHKKIGSWRGNPDKILRIHWSTDASYLTYRLWRAPSGPLHFQRARTCTALHGERFGVPFDAYVIAPLRILCEPTFSYSQMDTSFLNMSDKPLFWLLDVRKRHWSPMSMFRLQTKCIAKESAVQICGQRGFAKTW